MTKRLLIQRFRDRYHSLPVHEQVEYLSQLQQSLDVNEIDSWLIICNESYWNFIKKIETVEQF